MAVYFNMGIDCGAARSVADTVIAHFQDFTVRLPGMPSVVCQTEVCLERGRWFVGVWPVGMGYGIPPGLPSRPELADVPLRAAIGEALYERLQGISGFHRALFGGEAFDMLTFATEEEDLDVDYLGMVFADLLFQSPAGLSSVRVFSPGYSKVTGITRSGQG